MNKYTNKQGEYRKPYFPFMFDPLLNEDSYSLDKFYQTQFELFQKKEYYVHIQAPADIKINQNTGCLIGRNITSGLDNVLKIFGVGKSKSDNNCRQVKLKNFRYLDGTVKNTNIIMRVVKQQKEDELTSRNYKPDAFIIVHFFNKKPSNEKNNNSAEPIKQFESSNNIVKNINQTSTNMQIKQQDSNDNVADQSYHQILKEERQSKIINNQKVFDYQNQSSNQNINNNYLQDIKINNNSSFNHNSSYDHLQNLNLNHQQNYFQQQPEVSQQKQQREKSDNTERNNQIYREMKKEYLELDVEEQKNIAEGEAKYYKNLYLKQQIQLKEEAKKNMDLQSKLMQNEIEKLKSQIPMSQQLYHQVDNHIVID